tara:strand:+ start:225 stop:659 length:435 start_codon:yes stop_codon:yes gene_type:complete
MIFTKGSVKAVLNDKVIEDSTWNLESLDDKEFQMKLNRNGKKYDIRNFTLDDLGTILQNPHTIDDIDDNEIFRGNTIKITPYPKYSYKKTPTKRKSSKKTTKRSKRRSSLKKKKTKVKSCNKSSRKYSRKSKSPKASVNKKTVY